MREMKRYQVIVVGANGKMGREVIRGVLQSEDAELVGALDVLNIGKDVGEMTGGKSLGITVSDNLVELLDRTKPHVVIDFSHKEAARHNVPIALKKGYPVVMGTTGFSDEVLKSFNSLALEHNTGMLFAPNFSLGAVLLMKYARELSHYYSQSEIIEYHNDKKIDSPSGTALATAKSMRCGNLPEGITIDEFAACAQLPPSRGGEFYGYRVHSVRLKSMVAHQEVLFAGEGELLTIRHDSFSRESFIPGILLAVRKVASWKGLKIGLDAILD